MLCYNVKWLNTDYLRLGRLELKREEIYVAEKLTETAVCPVCRKSVEINSAQAKCPVCGHASSAEMFSKTKEKLNAENDAELYRLMATADAFFSKKNYDEAYVVYSSVLEIDRNYLKAYFRRELTSQYLMLKTSSVYLSNDSFFMKLDDVKERFAQLDLNDKEAKKLKMTMCKDMIEYISVRVEYENKYASSHSYGIFEKGIDLFKEFIVAQMAKGR